MAISKEKKQEVMSVIWRVLERVGMFTVAFMAPNAVQLLSGSRKIGEFPRRQVRIALQRLEKKGYIRSFGEKKAWRYELTQAGSVILEKKKINEIAIKKPMRWDRKWRMVVFDIPEVHRHARNALRWKLTRLGFHSLNLSVWVHPFECQNEINAIVEYYRVGKYVRYAIVESFDGMEAMEQKCREVFNG